MAKLRITEKKYETKQDLLESFLTNIVFFFLSHFPCEQIIRDTGFGRIISLSSFERSNQDSSASSPVMIWIKTHEIILGRREEPNK